MSRSGQLRIMGLDFGAKTVGVAISDPLLLTAQGIEVIRRDREEKQRQTLARIAALVTEYGVTEIVLGMPYHMDGQSGERGEKTLAFKAHLERRTGLPVVLQDERLTTVEAEHVMAETGMKQKKKREFVDIIAAVLILQEYLYEKSKFSD